MVKRKEFAAFFFGSAVVLLIAAWWHVLVTGDRFEALETVRSGVPYVSLLRKGFRPISEGSITYQGSSARFARFTSNSEEAAFGGVRSLDFGVIINDHGIIEAAFALSSEEDRDVWRLITGER